MPAPTTTWDVRIVNVSDLSVVAYIPQFELCEFADSINDFGHGAVTFDRDASWIDDFYTANSNKYPWEGNYAIQILRSGSVAYTFVIEETEVEYAGETRQVVLGGRGLAACLTWAIVLPEGFDEADADPDHPDQVMFMGRGFGKTHDTQEELDAGTYSTDWPKHRAYGGGAFVHLFEEADTGDAGSWANVTEAQASRNGGAVTWPLSLDSSMSRTNDANGDAWSSGTYSSVNVTWLFEIASGLNMYDTLLECCVLQDNAQWNVSPTGVISIAKSLGTDRSSEVLLTVPQSQGSRNSLRSTDTRSRLYASNGYLFEAKSDSATVTRFGRREGFLDTDQAKGETVGEAAQQGLNEVKNELDEFTFAYQETDSTVAFVDFQVSDSVSIEYEAGIIQNRQITGLGASIASDGIHIEVVVGDIVDNAIATLEKKRKNESFSALLTSRQAMSKNQIAGTTTKAHLDPPTIVSTEVQKDGTERSVKINFKTPGWADQSGSTKDAASQAQMIAHFDAEAYVTSTPTTRYNAVKSIDRTTSNQDVTISNLGTKDGGYTGRVRAVGQHGEYSDWADTTFTLTEATEGGDSDPYKPDQVTGLSLFPMLNAILVKFTDFTGSTNPTISGSRGKYQIQISNASGGFNETSGNNWQWNVNSEGNAGESGAACKNFTVPDGSGFLCGNLKSTSPGTVHYVRVRCLNWDGTAGDWSGVSSVTLDSANKSQVGVMIGEDSIAASHILSYTITATEIASGTITADRLDADQVITSAIRMPQPPGANNAGEVEDGSAGNELKFNIDNAGNMWWGNYDTYADAVSRTPLSGSVTDNDVWNRVKGDGTEFLIGSPNKYLGYTSAFGIGAVASSVVITGDSILGNSGSDTTTINGNLKLNAGEIEYGSGTNKIFMKGAGNTDWGFTGQAIEFGTASNNDKFGLIKGGETNIDLGFGSPIVRDSITMGNVVSGGSTNYIQIVSDSSNLTYGAVVAARDTDTNIQSVLITAKEDVDITASDGELKIDADQGINIVTQGTPTDTAAKLWNDSGTLKWGTTAIGGSSGGNSWYFKVQGDSGEEIAEGSNDFIDLQYPTASAQKGIAISRSGNVATISHHVKNYTASNIHGGSGTPYLIWGIDSGYSWKTTDTGLISHLTGMGGSGLMTQTGILNTASLVNYTTTPNIPTAAHQGTYGSTSNNSGQTFIQDIFVDSHGHITGIDVATAGGSSGITSVTASSSFGLFATTTGTAVSIGINWSGMSSGAPDYTKNLIYDYGYGITYKCSMPQATSAGLSSGLSMGSTASFGNWITYVSNSQKAYTSREATKQHITTIPGADALTRVKALRPVNFYFNDKIEPENEMARLQKQRGFIAEEVAAVDPQLASYGWVADDGVTHLDPEKAGKTLDDAVPIIYQQHAILADVVAALQQMESRIAALEG